jgi:hypothetical protein
LNLVSGDSGNFLPRNDARPQIGWPTAYWTLSRSGLRVARIQISTTILRWSQSALSD